MLKRNNNLSTKSARFCWLPLWLFTGQNGSIILLGWTAGCVDAIGYLGLGRVFTANMTGNTVLLGVALGQGQLPGLLRAAIALLGFIVGVALATTIVVPKQRNNIQLQESWPISLIVALALEGLILVIFGVAWNLAGSHITDHIENSLIALLAIAMGMQSAAVQHLRIAGISTTYVTGTITSFITEVVDKFEVKVKKTAANFANSTSIKTEQVKPAGARSNLRLKAGLWFTYTLAAVVSSQALIWWQSFSILIPLVALAFVVCSHLRRNQF